MLLDEKIKLLKKVNEENISYDEYDDEIQQIIYDLDENNEELIEELKNFLVNNLENIESSEIDLRMLSYEDDWYMWFINEFKDKINVRYYLTSFADGVEDDLYFYKILIKNDIYLKYCDINEFIEEYDNEIFNNYIDKDVLDKYILNYNKLFN